MASLLHAAGGSVRSSAKKEIFYSAQWLLDMPKSGDRGLALILGNEDYGQPSGNQPPSAAQPAAAS
jgi:hypothetical protein